MKAKTDPDPGSSSTTVSPPVVKSKTGEIKRIMADRYPGWSSHGDRDGTVLPGSDRSNVPADVPQESYSNIAAGSQKARGRFLTCATCGKVFKESKHFLNHIAAAPFLGTGCSRSPALQS
jgi:hypothetical protein